MQVIRVASFAYQKGFGGHFHNDNSIAVLRDLPGVVVACPSNGKSAVKLLRGCMQLAHKESRVVVFLEPIALYMTKDLHQPGDQAWLHTYPALDEQTHLGEVEVYGRGKFVILTYGNGCYLARQAAKILAEKMNIMVKVIDLQWLSPLPEAAILKETAGASHILLVDEGRKSGSVSEGLMTLLLESGRGSIPIQRLTGEDCFIPLGNSWQCLLPSKDSIVKAVVEMLGVKKHAASQIEGD